MGLQLPHGFPTDHITWASRGHDDGADESLRGFDVVTAPGALEGMAYSAVFRRVGDGIFAIKGINSDGEMYEQCMLVWGAIRGLGLPYNEYRLMFACARDHMAVLDGGLEYSAADVGFSGSPQLTLYGNRALRLVCHRLGVRQPKRFPDEDEVPWPEELEMELLMQVLREGLD